MHSIKGITDEKKWLSAIMSSNQTFHHFSEWGQVKSITWTFEKQLLENYPIQIATRRSFESIIKLGYIPPLTESGLNSDILQEIKENSKKQNFDILIVELKSTDSKLTKTMLDIGYRQYFSKVQPKQTNILDLTQNEDTLFANMKGKYRREIRKAIKDGYVVTTYKSGTLAVNQFYEIIEAVVSRGKFATYQKEYFQKMFDLFGKIDAIEIHIVHRRETPEIPLGTYLVVYDKENAYELYGGTNATGRHERVGFLLKWRSIQAAKNKGVRIYDQWGVSETDSSGNFKKTDPLYNVSVFKKGFGGKNITYIPTMVLVNNPLKYGIYKFLMNFKPAVLKTLKYLNKE